MLIVRPTTTDWYAVVLVHRGWHLSLRDAVAADTALACAIAQIARVLGHRDWRLELSRRGVSVDARLHLTDQHDVAHATAIGSDVDAYGTPRLAEAVAAAVRAVVGCEAAYWADLSGVACRPAAGVAMRAADSAVVARGQHAAWAAPVVAGLLSALECDWCGADHWWVDLSDGRAVRRALTWRRPCGRCVATLDALLSAVMACHNWVVA